MSSSDAISVRETKSRLLCMSRHGAGSLTRCRNGSGVAGPELACRWRLWVGCDGCDGCRQGVLEACTVISVGVLIASRITFKVNLQSSGAGTSAIPRIPAVPDVPAPSVTPRARVLLHDPG